MPARQDCSMNGTGVDLSTTHLKLGHVVAIAAAIIGGAVAVARTYLSVSWDVRELSMQQKELATKTDLQALRPLLETSANASAAERVKFYLSHSSIECDLAVRDKRRTPCHMVFPVPGD